MKRLTKLRAAMKKRGVDAIAIYNLEGSDQPTTWYISGFSGSHSLVYISLKNAYIATDSRYFTQIAEQSSFDMVPINNDNKVKDVLDVFIKNEGTRVIGYNSSNISVKLFNSLFKDLDVENIIDCGDIIPAMRMVKAGISIFPMELISPTTSISRVSRS